MAKQWTSFPGSKSIAAAFIGCGIFILYENLAGAITWLSHVLGANSFDSLGLLPTVVLAFSQLLQADAPKCQDFLQGVVQHLSVSSWPLLLVIVGTVLSRDTAGHSTSK